jgi:hypothetical protein
VAAVFSELPSQTLTPEEIYEITHYKRPAEQLRELAELGIPARRRHDNTVCVLRVHYQQQKPADQRPKLKLDHAPKTKIR